ncbi:MAG: Type 1 glutamine amidotransferase-like domain-containing protein [Candidatus Micrarchaeia archaeon]
MAKLFLSGGGNAKQTMKLDNMFISAIPGDKKTLYIPVAMPESHHTFGECFDWFKNAMSLHSLDTIDMWTTLNNKKYSELSAYDAIYFGGGNTFRLLDIVKRSGFDKLIRRYMRSDGIVYGGSAGAIIMGKDIELAGFGGDADKNMVGLREFNGLNIVNGYSIQCHYTIKDDTQMKSYIRKTGINVIALKDNAGIVVEDGKIRPVGKVYVFEMNKGKVSKRLL